MRRLLAALSTCLVLAGCSLRDDPAPFAGQTGGPVDAYADAADKVMDRAAASVAAAKEATASGRTSAASAELTLAEAILPRPSPAAVRNAKRRAAELNQDEYDRAAELADKAQRDLETLWGMIEKQRGADDLALAQQQAELDAQRDLLLTGLGGLIILASVAAFFWGTAVGVSKAEAGIALATGSAVAVLPHVMANEYAEGVIAAAGLLGIAKLAQVLFLRRSRSRCATTAKALQPLGPHEHPAQKDD